MDRVDDGVDGVGVVGEVMVWLWGWGWGGVGRWEARVERDESLLGESRTPGRHGDGCELCD